MSTEALEAYLATVDAADAPAVRELHAAVLAAHPDFDVAVKYRILTYAVGADWRHWVCAVNVQRSGLCLRFLAGVLLEDPRGVLRPGSAQLMTWDIARGEAIDTGAVGDYVREAVAVYPYYRANAAAVSASAKAASAEAASAGRSARRRRRGP